MQGSQLKRGRLTENKMSLDDVWKYEVTEIHGYWQVMNSKLLEEENRKARDPNVKLWWKTESWWELDERRDLVGS